MTGFDSEIEQAGPGGEQDQTKQGQICCGFCCDMRRAVMVLSILNIIATLITMIIIVVATKEARGNEQVDQDELDKMEKALTGIVVMVVIGWFLSIGSLWGAWKFNYCPVAIQVVFTLISYLATNSIQQRAANVDSDHYNYGWINWIANLVFMAIFLYPYVMFCLEVRSGIMNVNTYQNREKHSCCCV